MSETPSNPSSQPAGSAATALLNNRYRLLATVAAGGMATVYKAQDTMLNRLVAVKVLRDRYARDPQLVQRFREEAASAANLNHPNIVTIFDVGSDVINSQPRHYIVMELIDGEDLKQASRARATTGAAFDVDEAVNLARQICEGVAYAHKRGLVHCDLKPQNVMLTSEGRAKVTDFGIARAFTSVLNLNAREEVVWGTPQYYAPEQAAGSIPTPASDVYSIGIMLYELLAGRLPFQAADTATLARLHQTAEPPSLAEANPSVTLQLESLVKRALAKDPAQRYRNADQMATMLASYLQQGEENTLMGMSPVKPDAPKPSNEPARPSNLPKTAAKPVNTGPSIEERIAQRSAVKPAAPAKPAPAQRKAPVVDAAAHGTGPANATMYTQSEPRGADFMLLLLAAVAVLCVLGLIPLYAAVYTEYTRPPAPSGPTPQPGAAPLNTPPTQAVAGLVIDPGASPPPTTVTPTATATLTPTFALPTVLVGSVLDDNFKILAASGGITLVVTDTFSMEPENKILAIEPNTTSIPLSSTLLITVSSGGRVRLSAQLPGIVVENARFSREEYLPGSVVQFEVTWTATNPVGRDYNVFVHLYDPNGTFTGVQDGDRAPQNAGASAPTSLWAAGTRVVDTYRIPIPLNAQPGDYEIRIGSLRWQRPPELHQPRRRCRQAD